MKTRINQLALLGVLFIGLVSQARSAITITSITQAEYISATTSNPTAWVASANGAFVGGTTETGHISASANTFEQKTHVWSHPETMTVNHDSVGNLSISAGSDSVVVQPLLPFNAIFLRANSNFAFGGGMSFTDGTYNSTPIPDINLGDIESEYMKILLGEASPEFTLEGKFNFTYNASSPSPVDFGEIRLVGVNVNTVPEPSSFVLIGLGSLAFLLKRRRS